MNLKKWVDFLGDYKGISARSTDKGMLIVSSTRNRAYYMEAERFHIHLFEKISDKPLQYDSEPLVLKKNLLQEELIVELFKYYKV